MLGPVVSRVAARRVDAQVADVHRPGRRSANRGRAARASRATTSRRPCSSDVPDDSRAGCEELFGPVAVVHVVDDLDEAIDFANDTPWGLGGFDLRDRPGRDRRRRSRDSTSAWSSPTPSSPRCPNCPSAAPRSRASVANSASSACASSPTSSPSTSRESVLLRSRGVRTASRRSGRRDGAVAARRRGQPVGQPPRRARRAPRGRRGARRGRGLRRGQAGRRHLHRWRHRVVRPRDRRGHPLTTAVPTSAPRSWSSRSNTTRCSDAARDDGARLRRRARARTSTSTPTACSTSTRCTTPSTTTPRIVSVMTANNETGVRQPLDGGRRRCAKSHDPGRCAHPHRRRRGRAVARLAERDRDAST